MIAPSSQPGLRCTLLRLAPGDGHGCANRENKWRFAPTGVAFQRLPHNDSEALHTLEVGITLRQRHIALERDSRPDVVLGDGLAFDFQFHGGCGVDLCGSAVGTKQVAICRKSSTRCRLWAQRADFFAPL